MDPLNAYGMAVTLGPPPPQAPVAAAPPATSSAWATGLGDIVRVNRWESAAVGTLVVIGLALYTNALLSAS